MKKKLITLALLVVLALGGTSGVFAAAHETLDPTTQNTFITAATEQPKEVTAANTKTTISEDQAKQIAMESVKEGTFVSIGLQDDGGVILYSVQIQSGTNINDVKVDANTGKILKTDQGTSNGEKHHLEEKSKDKDNAEYENKDDDPTGY
ncbi:PepSY domain-containing protein [Acetobacterium sp.]|uniref:PepSY domain-containing protein n=1 Tax=Acetobacterium sp. TaxID=1872094 RepID=UPI002F40BAFC